MPIPNRTVAIGAKKSPIGVLAKNAKTQHVNANSKHTKHNHIITFAVNPINKISFLFKYLPLEAR